MFKLKRIEQKKMWSKIYAYSHFDTGDCLTEWDKEKDDVKEVLLGVNETERAKIINIFLNSLADVAPDEVLIVHLEKSKAVEIYEL